MQEQAKMKTKCDNLRFRNIDANDLRKLKKLSQDVSEEICGNIHNGGFTVVCIDISGSVTLDNLMKLIDRYESSKVFGDGVRLFIVKSYRLACFLDRSFVYENSVPSTHLATQISGLRWGLRIFCVFLLGVGVGHYAHRIRKAWEGKGR